MSSDPFPVAKRHVQEQVNKLQQDYSRCALLAQATLTYPCNRMVQPMLQDYPA